MAAAFVSSTSNATNNENKYSFLNEIDLDQDVKEILMENEFTLEGMLGDHITPQFLIDVGIRPGAALHILAWIKKKKQEQEALKKANFEEASNNNASTSNNSASTSNNSASNNNASAAASSSSSLQQKPLEEENLLEKKKPAAPEADGKGCMNIFQMAGNIFQMAQIRSNSSSSCLFLLDWLGISTTPAQRLEFTATQCVPSSWFTSSEKLKKA